MHLCEICERGGFRYRCRGGFSRAGKMLLPTYWAAKERSYLFRCARRPPGALGHRLQRNAHGIVTSCRCPCYEARVENMSRTILISGYAIDNSDINFSLAAEQMPRHGAARVLSNRTALAACGHLMF